MNALPLVGAFLVIFACALLEAWRHKSARDAVLGLTLRPGPNGEIVVPLTAAFKGVGHNSLRPALTILPDGIRFRVLGEERWAFWELTQVSVGATPFGASLRFATRDKGALRVHLASGDLARQVLALLPASIPLTRKAAAMRLAKL